MPNFNLKPKQFDNLTANKLNFQDGVRGRDSVASKDIGPGEILLVEREPAAWFLSWDKASTNCQFCCGAIQKQRGERMDGITRL